MAIENIELFAVAGKRFDIGGDNLKVKFEISYDQVAYLKVTVIKMKDIYRGKGTLDSIEESGKVYALASQNKPDISVNSAGVVLYICGLDRTADRNSVLKVFPTVGERNKVLNAFCRLVDKINANEADKYVEVINADGSRRLIVGGLKLRVEFKYVPDSRWLTAKVLEQAETLRHNGVLATHDGYSIESQDTPELRETCFYIRGDSEDDDDNEVECAYYSSESRDSALKAYIALIDKLNRITPGDVDLF